MRQILAAEYEQVLMLPPSVEEWVGPEHPARFVREFVAQLDLRGVGLDTLEREEGGVAYDPGLLVGAWLYGYLRKIRSTRALERACAEEMGFIWLTGNHRPDHNALWRFWHAHRDGLRALFGQSVKVAMEMDLVGLVVQALDGTKIAAVSSGRGGFDRAHLEKLLARLETELVQREAEIARAEAEASVDLPAELQRKVELREQVRAALARVQSGETRHAHPLEPEAARMPCDGVNRFGYNAQAVVDARASIVVAHAVVAAASDTGQLVPMMAQAQSVREAAASAETAPPLTLADGGYASAAQLAAAEHCGYPVLVPPPGSWHDTSNPYHAAHFRHDPERQVVSCPQGRTLPLQRVRQKDGRRVEVYRSAKVCRDCPVRAQCTSDRGGRAIDIQPGHAALVQAHARWHEPGAAQVYARRAPTAEPRFAQIKQQMGFRRWTLRGLHHAGTQWSLLCTTWNLKVILRHWRDRGGLFSRSFRSPAPTPRGAPVRPQATLSSAFAPPSPNSAPSIFPFAAAA